MCRSFFTCRCRPAGDTCPEQSRVLNAAMSTAAPSKMPRCRSQISGGEYTTRTDNTGHYLVAFEAAKGPAVITVSAGGFVTQDRSNVQVIAGETHTEDFTLRPDLPCLNIAPTLLEDTVDLGTSHPLQFTIGNTGASAATYQILEGHDNTVTFALGGRTGAALQQIRGQYSPHRAPGPDLETARKRHRRHLRKQRPGWMWPTILKSLSTTRAPKSKAGSTAWEEKPTST